MDGLALLYEIQRRQPDTPTVLISGHGEHDLTIQAMRGGAYDFIQKPIDRDYFIAAIERAIQTRELRREVAAQRAALERHAAELEATVEERTRELKQANEAKDEFLGMISHEMRTPLTLISGGASILRARGDSLDEEAREAVLHDIEMESARLTRIVEDLLVLARTELGNEIVTEPVSLHAVVEHVTANIRTTAARRIDVGIEAGLPPVAAEQTYLERVVANLVSNADKYSLPGAPIRVEVHRLDSHAAACSVVDAGPGVPAEELDLIFERFYRSGATATRVQGVGMGLTVCMRLVEAMSGRIWAGQTPEGGFEVGFSVPFCDESEMPAEADLEPVTA
jgi:signal transduction histidine kinase